MAAAPESNRDLLISRLDAFSQAALKKIAQTLGVQAASADRPGYLQALASVIGTRRHREALRHHLSADQWELLSLLPVRFGPFRLRVLVLASFNRGATGDDVFRDTLQLLACGCLLPRTQGYQPSKLGIDKSSVIGWGPNAVLELAPGIFAWAQEHHRPAALAPIDPPATVAGSTLSELQRALFVLLAELTRKPLRMTQEGHPHKTDLRNLASALAGPEAGKRKAANQPPPLLYFALALLEAAHLLHEKSDALRPTAEASRFFRQSPAKQARTLLDGWHESTVKEHLLIPGVEFGYSYATEQVPLFRQEESSFTPRWIGVSIARQSLSTAIAEGAALAPDAWYSIDAVIGPVYEQYSEMLFPRIDDYGYQGFNSLIRPSGQRRPYMGVHRKLEGAPTGTAKDAAARALYPDTDWQEVEGAFLRLLLATSMRWLGLVEAGPDAAHPDRFHLTPLGQHLLCGVPLPETDPAAAGRIAVVQPDYEVIVLDANRSLGLLAQLDGFAERRTLDRAATYRLTQVALARGLDDGWTGKRVLKTLETANDGPLPQNVRYSLEEWIRLYESLTLREQSCLLEAENEGQLDAWLADSDLSKLLGARLGPTTVRVASRRVEQVFERLAALQEPAWQVDYSHKPSGVLTTREPDLIDLQADQAEPYLRYRLETFGDEVARTDAAITYQITRDSVQRAIAAGTRLPQMLEFLTRAAGEALANDVVVRLHGWAGVVNALQAEPLIAVALPAAPIGWAMLLRIPAISALVRAQPTGELALVAPDDLPALRSELARRGLGVEIATLTEEHLGPKSLPSGLSLAGTPAGSRLMLVPDLGAFDLGGDDDEMTEAEFEVMLTELGLLRPDDQSRGKRKGPWR